MYPVSPTVNIPESELNFTFARSGGPGGQNVNKVNSKAIMRWAVVSSTCLPHGVHTRFIAKYGNRLTTEGELVIASQRYRDQNSNMEDCWKN
ncbi:MAG: aminoacyl-tRNA hydrolase [Candidatus Obscuribacterales bacterium]|nr:aminoacyl-tRNA hydrolase [Candidatus Obscuribacterales bacterium]